MRRLTIPALALSLLLIAASAAVAQTATPAVYPLAPDPSECIVEPTPIEQIVAITATPIAESIGSATPFVPPMGDPAGTEISAEVTATLHQVFACANAGDPLRVASLFTEEFARSFFGGVPLADLLNFLAAPPQPLSEDQKRIIVRFGAVQLLPDGRAGVVIVLDEPDDPRTEEPDFAILREIDGRWLVDELHEDGGATSTSASGTPAA
jgi:hypothetical protein